jgi:hypothetical protein
MPNCCGGASCACVLTEGDHLTIIGSGTSQDPFELTADVDLAVVDNTVFNLTLTGAGTVASPWSLSVAFAATAKLDDLPDVNAPSPTNTQVLGWDSATSKWTARAPTTAASGSVTHDTSLTGDGSGGSPLAVVSDETFDVTTRAAGIGVTDSARRQSVRRFANAAARTTDAGVLAPQLNSLSILDDQPGIIWYYTGSTWVQQVASFDSQVIGTAFLQLSGAFTTQRMTRVLKKLSTTTDGLGSFDVLTAADLSSRAGVLGVQFTATDPTQVGAAFQAVLFPNVTKVSAIAYRMDDGTPWAGVSVNGLVEAWVY